MNKETEDPLISIAISIIAIALIAMILLADIIGMTAQAPL